MYRLVCLIILAVSALNPLVEATPSLGAWTAGPPLEDSWDRWDNALKRVGVVNQDSKRAEGKGNDLYDGEHVYLSGHVFQEAQGKMRYSLDRRILSDLRGKTVAQLLLNNDSVADHLILAEYILSVYVPPCRSLRGVFPSKKETRERVGAGSLTLNAPPGFIPAGCPVWTRYVLADLGCGCPLCALFQPSGAPAATFTQRELNALKHMCSTIMSAYAAKLEDYVAWAQGRFKGLWRDASGSPEAHTEIMLLYDYRGRRLPGCVYSRYSMCKTCEPAVVDAVRSREWSAPVAGLSFTAEQLYPDSYCAGEAGSPVKKTVLLVNSNQPMPLDKLRACGARNDLLEATLSDVWRAHRP